MTEKDACKNCRFWIGPLTGESAFGSYGYCRRKAPVLDNGLYGKFPKTIPENWCGEHERKKDNE